MKVSLRSEAFLLHSDNAKIVLRYLLGYSQPEIAKRVPSTKQNISRIISTYNQLVESEKGLEFLPNGGLNMKRTVEHYLPLMSLRLQSCLTELDLLELEIGNLKEFPEEDLMSHRKFGPKTMQELKSILKRSEQLLDFSAKSGETLNSVI